MSSAVEAFIAKWSASEAATQETLAGTEAPEEDGAEAPAPTAAKPWPRKMAEQLVLVRDLVTENARAWSLDELGAAFSKAPPDEIEAVLESLASLGHLVSFKAGEAVRWKVAGVTERREEPPKAAR